MSKAIPSAESMTSEAPASEIHFSQVREDPQLELQLVDEVAEASHRPLRVLMVGSGGCSALSVLAKEAVGHLDAVDINPAQGHLVELRRTALCELNCDEQLMFIGEAGPNPEANGAETSTPMLDDGADDRLELYSRLRPALPEATRAFWDRRTDQIAFGVNNVGTFDQMVAEVGQAFEEAGIDPLEQPAVALGHAAWVETFGKVFDNSRLGELIGSAMTHYSATRSFAQHFSTVFASALRRFAGQDNYFLHHVFRRRYGRGNQALPPYLLEENQAAIRAHGPERLEVHTGNFVGKMQELAKEGGPFDLIQTSDLSDWMPVREVHKLYSAARECLAEQGAVLSRRLCGDHSLARLMSSHLRVDAALSDRLFKADRSFLYSEIVVGFMPEPA